MIYRVIQVIGEEGIMVDDDVPSRELPALDLATCNGTLSLTASRREA
jgi:hypothetical protein